MSGPNKPVKPDYISALILWTIVVVSITVAVCIASEAHGMELYFRKLSPEERQIIAQILAGESPVRLMGKEAAVAVTWTIRNRMLGGMGVNDLRTVYYASRWPTAAEHMVVDEVFTARQDADPTSGALYALSAQDVAQHKLRPGDMIFASPVSGILQIHIYKQSPF